MSTITAWPGLNSAPFSLDELRRLHVGRSAELQICSSGLAKRHNVLIYGDRGIGKTFLVKLMVGDLENSDLSVFPVFISVPNLMAYSPRDKVSAFPRAVILESCAKIWRALTKRSYLDLRESLRESGSELKFQSSAEVMLKSIYRNLMDEERTTRFEEGADIGFAVGLKGSKSERKIRELKQSEILPFEFLEFVDEINSTVLPALNKNRIVVVCDEANWLPIYDQQDILNRYLELFAAKNLQFVFVAGYMPWEAVNNLPACFETQLELKGLDRISTKSLLQRTAKDCGVNFSQPAIATFWRFFKGHPRLTLQAGSLAHQRVSEKGQNQVDQKAAKVSCQVVNRRHQDYLKMLYPPTDPKSFRPDAN